MTSFEHEKILAPIRQRLADEAARGQWETDRPTSDEVAAVPAWWLRYNGRRIVGPWRLVYFLEEYGGFQVDTGYTRWAPPTIACEYLPCVLPAAAMETPR